MKLTIQPPDSKVCYARDIPLGGFFLWDDRLFRVTGQRSDLIYIDDLSAAVACRDLNFRHTFNEPVTPVKVLEIIVTPTV